MPKHSYYWHIFSSLFISVKRKLDAKYWGPGVLNTKYIVSAFHLLPNTCPFINIVSLPPSPTPLFPPFFFPFYQVHSYLSFSFKSNLCVTQTWGNQSSVFCEPVSTRFPVSTERKWAAPGVEWGQAGWKGHFPLTRTSAEWWKDLTISFSDDLPHKR